LTATTRYAFHGFGNDSYALTSLKMTSIQEVAASACERVLGTVELLEHIVAHLPAHKIMQVKAVSRYWREVIVQSPAVCAKLTAISCYYMMYEDFSSYDWRDEMRSKGPCPKLNWSGELESPITFSSGGEWLKHIHQQIKSDETRLDILSIKAFLYDESDFITTYKFYNRTWSEKGWIIRPRVLYESFEEDGATRLQFHVKLGTMEHLQD
jgi:hypothetical protein